MDDTLERQELLYPILRQARDEVARHGPIRGAVPKSAISNMVERGLLRTAVVKPGRRTYVSAAEARWVRALCRLAMVTGIGMFGLSKSPIGQAMRDNPDVLGAALAAAFMTERSASDYIAGGAQE
jgi:hypothetical protein